MSNKRVFDVSITIGVSLVPVNSNFKSFLPAHLLLPSKLVQLSRIDSVTQIVELSIRNKGNIVLFILLLSKHLDQALGYLKVGKFVTSSNVVDQSIFSLVKDAVECTCDIYNVEKVTGIASISVDGDGKSTQDLVSELGDELLGELMGSVYIVSPSDDTWKLERTVVGLDEELSSSLGCSIRVSRLKNVLFVHWLGVKVFSLSVYLISRNVNEPLHCVAHLCALEENVCSVDVRLGECERVSKGVINVGLGCKVKHGINVVLLEYICYKITTANVSFHEFEVGEILNLIKILKA